MFISKMKHKLSTHTPKKKPSEKHSCLTTTNLDKTTMTCICILMHSYENIYVCIHTYTYANRV